MKGRYLKNRDNENNWERIIVLTGARQTGKTTFARRMFANYPYISIEDPVMRSQYASLTAMQWHDNFPQAILDEIQKEPQLIESIKAVYDQYTDTKYILLGSSQILLLKQIKESLAGRCIIKEIYPLTLPEIRTSSWDDVVEDSPLQKLIITGIMPSLLPSFLLDNKHSAKMKAWNHYITYGGYPILTDDITDEESRWRWLATYIRTYLERDIRDIASFKDLEPYIKLQKILALQTAGIVTASNIAKDIGVTSKTVSKYIQYLEISYQAFTLQAWDRNPAKKLSKAPKLHYIDYGIIQAILHKRSPIPTGNEFESIVVAEIYKQIKQTEMDAQFYHLRTSDGKEIDLLIEVQNGYYAFEIKMTEHVARTDARHLLTLDNILDKPLLAGFVLSNDPIQQKFSNNIFAINIVQFLG